MDNKEMLRQYRAAERARFAMIVGMILGGLAAFLLGAYVLVPLLGGSGFWATVVAVPIGAYVGQQAAVSLLLR